MLKKTHLAFGSVCGLAALPYLPMLGIHISEPSLSMQTPGFETYGAAVLLGALLPDIDKKGTTISRHVPVLPWLFSKVFGHRTALHSLLFVWLLYTYLPYWLPMPFVIGLVIGVLSHLLGDMMTHQGIRLLWPLPFDIRLPMTFETGGKIEYVILKVLTVVAAYQVADITSLLPWITKGFHAIIHALG
ncbi:metal-dependent hydrolase [Aneurinibacillus aneurinilyticus]|uniref:metal-dependent hydrolase n=1 Tax=Aneurinibacillus aneurinilyticus TaxID=1391 RepID=UPI002E1FBF2D|nr:metal-dependent hydrolase [Aneurinibacillus aneurinilyticus]MED0726439.1 metal-dependent hydrolase [Aneurinibacillus aneurinilyticus]